MPELGEPSLFLLCSLHLPNRELEAPNKITYHHPTSKGRIEAKPISKPAKGNVPPIDVRSQDEGTTIELTVDE